MQAAVAYLALFGSVAVSYMRARAETVGLQMREGLFRRQERVVVLGAGMLLNQLTVAVVILAVLANLTAVQRFGVLARELRATDH
jgi:phosphatidylglycerophosphate synthase